MAKISKSSSKRHVSNIKRVQRFTIVKEPKEYVVQKILGDRKRNGIKEYHLKWRHYGDMDSTWEPEENLVHCKQLLAEYNASKLINRKREVTSNKPYKINNLHNADVNEDDENYATFEEIESEIDPNKVMEKVIGVTNVTGQLNCCVKWKGVELAEFISCNGMYEKTIKKFLAENQKKKVAFLLNKSYC